MSHSFDVNDWLGETSFKARYQNWENNPFVQDFSKWTAECFSNLFIFFNETHWCFFIGQLSENGDDEAQKSSLEIMFQIDAQGYPLLPSLEMIKNTRLLHKKLLIGKFLSDMHHAYHLPTCRLLSHLPSVARDGLW